jgi:peptide/nickel transport system permease protein
MSRTDVISMIDQPERSRRGRLPAWLRTPSVIASCAVLFAWLLVILIPALTPHDLAAARVSVPNGLMIVAAAALLGTAIGLVAGFFGGWIDEILMRIADLVFAFPGIILAMAIAAALGPSIQNAVIAAAISWWPAYARAVRSIVLALRESEFVLSNRLSGVGPLRSILVDLLPAVSGSVLVLAMLDIGAAILFLAGLSFLGLGAVPPTPEWGSMISGAVQYFDQWWLAIAPGIAVVSVVLAFNIIGDAIRDSLEPRMSENGAGS